MPHVIAKSSVTGNYVPLDHPEATHEVISGELRKVTMHNVGQQPTDDGPREVHHEAVDYVPVEHVQQYAAEARTRWQDVTVGTAHESGPGGDDQHLLADDHPVAAALNSKVSK